jgi:TPR repeat protein
MSDEKQLPLVQATKIIAVAGQQGSLVSRGLDVLNRMNVDAQDDNNATRQWELACEYLKGTESQRDYERAFYWLSNAAEQGHVQAQFALGALYAAGDGVKQDDIMAMTWYGKASDQGHAWAKRKLAELQGV